MLKYNRNIAKGTNDQKQFSMWTFSISMYIKKINPMLFSQVQRFTISGNQKLKCFVEDS